ncbi:MAG TPA: hypothetical protein ENI08_00775 [Candidatus Dependentiae bacterium]|nr:hypothetical protein [Candidatus Dependentiae bacterium]
MTLKDLSEREQVEKEVIDVLHVVRDLIKNKADHFNHVDLEKLGDAEWNLRKIKNHFKEKKHATTKS